MKSRLLDESLSMFCLENYYTENKVNLQHNKLIHLEDFIVVYGVYNAETLEKLITTIHQMHHITTPNERLFASKLASLFTCYLTKNEVHHYAINSPLYPRMLREKYIKMYEEFVTHVCKSNKNSIKMLFIHFPHTTITLQ